MSCDHEPLFKTFYSRSQLDTARECRHLSEIVSLCTNLEHIKWCNNVVTAPLSRVEIDAILQDDGQIDWKDFAKTQQNDFVLKRYLDEITLPTSVLMSDRVSNYFVTLDVVVCRVRWFPVGFGVSFSIIATT